MVVYIRQIFYSRGTTLKQDKLLVVIGIPRLVLNCASKYFVARQIGFVGRSTDRQSLTKQMEFSYVWNLWISDTSDQVYEQRVKARQEDTTTNSN